MHERYPDHGLGVVGLDDRRERLVELRCLNGEAAAVDFEVLVRITPVLEIATNSRISTMTMYAKWFYEFSPEQHPVITFSNKGNRDALLGNAKAGEVIVFVATKGENTSDEDKGRVLGAAEIGRKAVRTEEVVDIFDSPPVYFVGDKFRWSEAIPMLRAWRFDPRPLANEVFENGNLPPHAQTQAVPLSDTDEDSIRSLNWVPVDLPQTEERQKQKRLSDAFSVHPTKPGPVVSPGTHGVTVLERDKAWTYAARFGDTPMWKIGQTNDLENRVQDLNTHVPVEYLQKQWRLSWRQEWPSAERALEMEQRVLELLADKRTQGERVKCNEDDLKKAWIKAIFET